ncbi:hypothetical protein SAMN00120144_3204 [Hymenobacter roseosalivarius DSM 11622]|uniref:Uncharacterized protein n=1 Tax=Hymenobacter roseosalivarius DSM 11622 TaxID=645990 RepID=A0A1W1W2V3_9BACT|nr:hypothetical protein SAMN00120144_3204 [Hymenobacter roseosalivarius DSM 11622]
MGSYSFVPNIAYMYTTCPSYIIKEKDVGAINLNAREAVLSGFIIINEDGSLSANSFYACKDWITTFKIE